MDARTFRMHTTAAKFAGRESACGTKIRHSSELRADQVAVAMQMKYPQKAFEAYPCPFCLYWHVGRMFTPKERAAWYRITKVMAESGILESMTATRLLMNNWDH